MAIQPFKLTIFTWQASIISKLEQIHKSYHIHIKYGEVRSSETTLTCISRNRVDIWFSSFTWHQSKALKSPSHTKFVEMQLGFEMRSSSLEIGKSCLPHSMYSMIAITFKEERRRVNLCDAIWPLTWRRLCWGGNLVTWHGRSCEHYFPQLMLLLHRISAIGTIFNRLLYLRHNMVA